MGRKRDWCWVEKTGPPYLLFQCLSGKLKPCLRPIPGSYIFLEPSAHFCVWGRHGNLGWPLIALLSIWKVITSHLRSLAYSGKCNLRDISSEVQISLALEGFKGPLEAWGLLQVCLPFCKSSTSWAGVKRLGRGRGSLGNGREGETTPRQV